MMKTKKAIGKRKDKLNWEIIEEFVGLRAKMYSLKAKKEKRKKKEGKRGNIVKKDMSHQNYLDCLFEKRKFMHTIRLCDHLNINSTPPNRIKSPLALTMINNT